MQPKFIVLAVALAGTAMALPAPVTEVVEGASLENVETAAWYGWVKRDVEKGASLENVETAAWYGWVKRALGLVKKGEEEGASLENVETAAWYGWV